VRDFLRELNRSEGTTVILTTHDLDDITRLCSRLLIIDHGRRIYDGTVEALRTAYGTTRVLVVDLADDEPAEVAGPCSPGPRGGGAGSSSPATRSARPS
jgi:ABC-2 type transport system ATP-binding protein